jgi:hypothetical protein
VPGRPPASEYQDRLEQRRHSHRSLSARDARFSVLRLATFAAGLLAGLAAWRGLLPWSTLAIAVIAFLFLLVRHDRVIALRDAAARAVLFYEHGLARIQDRWGALGSTGDQFRDDHHLYANDLDLFGPASLFQLLSVARTRAGEDTLAAWLTAPATPAEIRSRQQAAGELAPELDLREALSLAGSDVAASVDSAALASWAEGAPALKRPGLRVVAALLSAAAIATAAYWAMTGFPGPFLIVVALEVLFSIPQRARIQKALHAAEGPARDLDVLAHVLARLEQHSFTADRLVALRRGLDTSDMPASTAIRRLHRLVELHDWQHNQFFAPFAAAVLWGTHLAWAIEAWRRRHGARVREWLAIVGTFEALASLAAYRYEHPDDVWPEVVEDGPAVFEGRALGHPLLPASRCVRNDVMLTATTRLLIVSGSNMSGKSTLLRTVGINAVLALAGAPVRAASLRLAPVSVGATLRIQDSLLEGRSRFYAEITRLRQLADVA